MSSWEFDIGITTHAALQNGTTAIQHTRVEVEADNYLDASRLAIQMGFCVGYVTSCEYIE